MQSSILMEESFAGVALKQPNRSCQACDLVDRKAVPSVKLNAAVATLKIFYGVTAIMISLGGRSLKDDKSERCAMTNETQARWLTDVGGRSAVFRAFTPPRDDLKRNNA